MEELRLNLEQDATRANIVAQLQAALPTDVSRIEEAVKAAGVPEEHHHNLAEILRTIDGLQGVSERVREDMRAIYQILTEAEASVHGVSVETAHFHEVGRAAGVRNALEICLLMEAIAPQRFVSTKVQPGSGKIQCAHGEMDAPAPAAAAIIARGIPLTDAVLPGELITPTSAAIIYHFVDEYI